MYESYWRMREQPFRDDVDPRWYCGTAVHEEALSRMLFAIDQRRQLAALTGASGTGKTLVLHSLEHEMRRQPREVALIDAADRDAIELLWQINGALGLAPSEHDSSARLWRCLEDYLKGMSFARRHTTLILDEPDLNADSAGLVNRLIRLAESPWLTLMLAARRLPGLLAGNPPSELVDIQAVLHPMNLADTERYIEQRVRLANGPDGLFSPETVEAIQRHSRGFPRLVNHICDLTLLAAMDLERPSIDGELIHIVCSELAHVA